MKKPTPKQMKIWNIPAVALEHGSPLHLNMRRLYGWGPEGAKCGSCVHLRDDFHHNKKYFKCELAGYTRGPATDWRKKWRACGKYEEKTNE